jgi:hypothetical protein
VAHIVYTYKGKVINLSSLSKSLKKMGVPGASESNLSRVFSGRHRPRLDLALALAKLGGFPVTELDAMLKHCAKQRKDWKYVPVFGRVSADKPSIAVSKEIPGAYVEEGIDEARAVDSRSN